MNRISAAFLNNDILMSVLLICIINSKLSEELHPQISRTKYTHQDVNEANIHHNELTLHGFRHFYPKLQTLKKGKLSDFYLLSCPKSHSVKILWRQSYQSIFSVA